MNLLRTAAFAAILSTALLAAAPVASAGYADLLDGGCHAYDVACESPVCHYSYTYGWQCSNEFCYVYTTSCVIREIP